MFSVHVPVVPIGIDPTSPNPSNAEATFVKSTKAQRFLKNNFEPCHVGIHWIPSDEYPCARVSVIFLGFLHHFVLAKLATTSIRVKVDQHN